MKKEFNRQAGLKIKAIRERKGLTQDQLARMMGYRDRSAITRIEKGDNGLSHENIIKFCNVLDVSPLEILGTQEELIQQDDPFLEYIPYLKKAPVAYIYTIRRLLGMSTAEYDALLVPKAETKEEVG